MAQEMFPVVQRTSEECFEPRQPASSSSPKAFFSNQTEATASLLNSCLKADVPSPEEIAAFFASLERGLSS